jgi:hypothetical protein
MSRLKIILAKVDDVNMFKRLQSFASNRLLFSPVFIWEYVAAALLMAAFISRGVAELFKLVFAQKYSQLIVGAIAWEAGSKQPDYLILSGFLVGFFLIYLGLRVLAQAVQGCTSAQIERTLRNVLTYAMIPAAIWSGIATVSNPPSLDFLILSLVLMLLTLLFSGALLAKKLAFERSLDYEFSLVSNLLIVVFSMFDGLGLVLAVNRLRLDWQIGKESGAIAAAVFAGLGLLVLLVLWIQVKNVSFLIQRSRVIVWASQAFLPLGFFTLLPTPWSLNQQRFYGYTISPFLYGLIASLLAISYVDWLRRLPTKTQKKDGVESNDSAWKTLSPACLIALLFYLKSAVVGVSALPVDDYHWGEFLLPWWSWQQFGFLPFQDFEPARGLVGYCTGLLANLFLNGDAASYSAIAGKPLLALPFLSVAFWAISRSLGYLPAFLGLLLMPQPDGLFEIDSAVTAGLCLVAEQFLASRATQRRPNWHWTIWLMVWASLCVLLILFAPGQGGLFTLSTVPLAGWALYTAIRREPQALWKAAIAVPIVLVLLIWATPLDEMLWGAVRYGLEQSSLNSVAYGVEWYKSRGRQTFLSYPLWELVRIAWIVACVAVGLLLYWGWARGLTNPKEEPSAENQVQRSRFFAFTIPIFLILVLLIPRSAGRIDPGSISRLGNTSIWALCLLLPIALLTAFKRFHKPLILLIVAFVGTLLPVSSIGGFPSLELAFQQPTIAIDVTGTPLVNGRQIGLPALNNAVVDPAHLQKIQRANALLRGVIDPGETFLDLSNHGALHFYLGYPPLMGAAYNTVGTGQQLRALQQIEATNPPVVLAYLESGFFDGGSAALRTHLVYRYAVQQYVPVAAEGIVVLVRPDRLPRLKSAIAAAPELAATMLVGDRPEIRLTLLDKVFAVSNYQRIPTAWGKSFSSLQAVVLPVTLSATSPSALHNVRVEGRDRFVVTGDRPTLAVKLGSSSFNGDQAGLLALDFTCEQKKVAPTLTLRWQTNPTTQSNDPSSAQNQINFMPKNGKQLIPLDTAPRWLLAKNLQAMQFELMPANACAAFKLENLAWYQRAEIAQSVNDRFGQKA